MKQFALYGKIREKSTKGYLNEMKAQGLVPGVVYGKEKSFNVCFFINDLKSLLYTKEVYKVVLNIEDKKYDVVVKDTQFHPLSDEPMHIDFLEIDDDKVVKVSYPILFTGTPEGAKQGGKVFKKMRKMRLKGKISDLPESMIVDITKLKLGDILKVRDIIIPNIEILEAAGTPIVSVVRSRVSDTELVITTDDEEGAEVQQDEKTESDNT